MPEPFHEPDPILGWRPVAGHHRFRPSPNSPWVTIRPDGARETGSGPPAGRPEVLLVGCSFTMGWFLPDDQTWAWRLQELRPDLAVVNRGVAGYGTLQSLILLEQILNSDAQRPARVLYGFIPNHSVRNVANPLWVAGLSTVNSRSVGTPYCTLTPDGGLERHPPEGLPSLPLHERLASVALVEHAWVDVWSRRASERANTGGRATQLLLLEMAELCRAHGVGFSLVLLTTAPEVEETYVGFARQHGIDVIDCHQELTRDKVTGRGWGRHPNALADRIYGDCIAAALSAPDRLPPP